MIQLNERFVVDKDGTRVGVFLEEKDYRKLMEELEELESLREFDAAKGSGDEAIPITQALSEIERARK